MVNYGVLFAAEFVGTMILILLGNGVVYNVIGRKTFGANGGWLMASFGWGMAVMCGVYVSTAIASGYGPGANGSGGGQLNPAVAIATLIQKGNGIDAPIAFIYIAGQLAGAFVGQGVLNVFNNRVLKDLQHASFGAHSCSPAYSENKPVTVTTNLFVEFVATGVLILVAVYALGKVGVSGELSPLIVGLLILSIAVSLGGLTGYAINPARDAMPRIVYSITHSLMKFEGSAIKAANWKYGWIPVVGPLAAGAVIGGFLAI